MKRLIMRLARLEQFIVTSEKCLRDRNMDDGLKVEIAVALERAKIEHKKLLEALTE